jgi:hypothetical protein
MSVCFSIKGKGNKFGEITVSGIYQISQLKFTVILEVDKIIESAL